MFASKRHLLLVLTVLRKILLLSHDSIISNFPSLRMHLVGFASKSGGILLVDGGG